jgi:hypothetical protein
MLEEVGPGGVAILLIDLGLIVVAGLWILIRRGKGRK